MEGAPDSIGPRLRRRLERERAARREAEAIAERVTGELYASAKELQRVNGELSERSREVQAANETMREFVAIASHDIRGPLASIIGYAGIVSSRLGALDEQTVKEYLDVIVRQGHRLDRLVGDLLTVSKIEAGALEPRSAPVELARLVADIASEFTIQGTTELDVHVPGDVVARADPDHVRRILVNYVSNAAKYGAPPIEIEAHRADDHVEIRVSDLGVGVPEEFVPRLFGRFARADTDASRTEKGTGLGLSIVRGLARANGGDTWYEPHEPHGSCFGVRLPLAG